VTVQDYLLGKKGGKYFRKQWKFTYLD
jgi:hypothetical protein